MRRHTSLTPADGLAININVRNPSALNDRRNVVKGVGRGRKVAETFPDKKARTKISKIQPSISPM